MRGLPRMSPAHGPAAEATFNVFFGVGGNGQQVVEAVSTPSGASDQAA